MTYKIENAKLNQAIYFATERHSGQVRKGTEIPFITHPMETMTILVSMNANTNLLIAGLLHDTVEDTDTTLEEIETLFGSDVAKLVGGHTEDKSRSWEERKETEMRDTFDAPLRLKMLVLADKLANLRSIYRDYMSIGEDLWKRFNAGAEKQAWYYGQMTDVLSDLQVYRETKAAYWEMVGVYKDIFVNFSIDKENGFIYQESISGEAYLLEKDKFIWRPFDGMKSEKAVSISRKDAERIEDEWNAPFWESHQKDLEDASYHIFSSASRSLTVSISEKQLTFRGNAYGKECQVINGKDEYEFYHSLNEDDTIFFLAKLRLKYGINVGLKTILENEFGHDVGSVYFTNLCDEMGIKYKTILI